MEQFIADVTNNHDRSSTREMPGTKKAIAWSEMIATYSSLRGQTQLLRHH